MDIAPEQYSEDLSFNDQESIVEIIIEKVLGFEDAIAEYDDADSDNLVKKGNLKIDQFTYAYNDPHIRPFFITTIKKKFPNHLNSVASGFHKLDTPPPKS